MLRYIVDLLSEKAAIIHKLDGNEGDYRLSAMKKIGAKTVAGVVLWAVTNGFHTR